MMPQFAPADSALHMYKQVSTSLHMQNDTPCASHQKQATFSTNVSPALEAEKQQYKRLVTQRHLSRYDQDLCQ